MSLQLSQQHFPVPQIAIASLHLATHALGRARVPEHARPGVVTVDDLPGLAHDGDSGHGFLEQHPVAPLRIS